MVPGKFDDINGRRAVISGADISGDYCNNFWLTLTFVILAPPECGLNVKALSLLFFSLSFFLTHPTNSTSLFFIKAKNSNEKEKKKSRKNQGKWRKFQIKTRFVNGN